MLFAIVGAAGNAILFIFSLIGLVIMTVYALAWAGHCYLVVVQGTAAGSDRVGWPDEPIFDWIVRGLFPTSLVVVLLGGAAILARALGPSFLPNQPELRFLLLAVPMVWLLFPVAMLSSLASNAGFSIFSFRLLWRLVQLGPALPLFYLVTAVLVPAAAALLSVGLLTRAWYVLPIAVVFAGAVLLLHARFLGRIGWMLSQLDFRSRKKAPRQKDQEDESPRPLHVNDPWAEPEPNPLLAPEPAPGGYRVVEIEEETPLPKTAKPADPYERDDQPYALADEPLPEKPAPEMPPVDEESVKRELRLRERIPEDPPPARPLLDGLWTFPFYESTLKAWFWLGLSGLAMGVFARAALAFWPW